MNTGSNPRDLVLQVPPPATASFAGFRSLQQALVHAYYQRDIETIRRLGEQAEQRLAALSAQHGASK